MTPRVTIHRLRTINLKGKMKLEITFPGVGGVRCPATQTGATTLEFSERMIPKVPDRRWCFPRKARQHVFAIVPERDYNFPSFFVRHFCPSLKEARVSTRHRNRFSKICKSISTKLGLIFDLIFTNLKDKTKQRLK